MSRRCVHVDRYCSELERRRRAGTGDERCLAPPGYIIKYLEELKRCHEVRIRMLDRTCWSTEQKLLHVVHNLLTRDATVPPREKC